MLASRPRSRSAQLPIIPGPQALSIPQVPVFQRPQPHASPPLVDLPTQTHLPPTTPLHPITMGWVGLLGLLQLGVLQTPTINFGQAVLLQGDIITHLAVLLLEV